jgi:uncharacterized damage-inducible protein DinB
VLEHLRDLLNHMAWADGVFFHAWSKGPQQDEELRERWSHVLGTAALFTEIVRGECALQWEKILSGEVRPPWLDQPLKSFGELKSSTQANHAKLAATLATWGGEDLQRRVRIPWFPDPPCVIGVGEALVQAAMHTQHHRGQCMTRLKDKGGENANVDYIIWLWKGRPAARWT